MSEEPITETGQACVLGHKEDTEAYEGFVCRRHWHWLADTLRQIEELFALRGIVLLPGPSTETRFGSRDGSPAPGRIGIMALTDHRQGNLDSQFWRDDPEAVPDVPGALYSWVRLMSEEREEQATTEDAAERARNLANINGDVSTIVSVLHRERHWMVRQAWIEDYVDDLAVLHRHVATAIGETPWPRAIGKCPNCGVSLFNTIGVDEVTCRRCKSAWSGLALVRLRLIFEQDAKTTAQAKEA